MNGYMLYGHMLLSHNAPPPPQKKKKPRHFTLARFTCTTLNFSKNDCVMNFNLSSPAQKGTTLHCSLFQ